MALPLALKPGRQVLSTNLGDIPFDIGGREYPEQRITLANQQMVSPNEERLARIRREAIEQREWYQRVSPQIPDLPMMLPIEGPITGASVANGFSTTNHAAHIPALIWLRPKAHRLNHPLRVSLSELATIISME